MGGTSQNTQTQAQNQTQVSTPWDAAQPALNASMSSALTEFNKGLQPYTGQRVASPDAATLQGQQYALDIANLNRTSPFGLFNQYQTMIDRGGYNAAQNDSLNYLNRLAGSEYSVSPELQKVIDAQSSKISDAVNLNASGAGRYGSGANQSLLAKNVGDFTNQTILSDYNNFLGRRDNANAQRAALGQQAIGNLGTAFTGLQAPGALLQGIGQQREAYNQNVLNSGIDQYDEMQNAQRNNINWLNALATGQAGLGGTQTVTGTTNSSTPGQSKALQLLGYGLSGAGALGGFL